MNEYFTDSLGRIRPKHTPHHGKRKELIYNVWDGMNQRCYNPNNPKYEHYGGRGIQVEWKDFTEFVEDMETSYLEHKKTYSSTTLDRINNNGNYSKENTRWATYLEQNHNQRPKKWNSSPICKQCGGSNVEVFVNKRGYHDRQCKDCKTKRASKTDKDKLFETEAPKNDKLKQIL